MDFFFQVLGLLPAVGMLLDCACQCSNDCLVVRFMQTLRNGRVQHVANCGNSEVLDSHGAANYVNYLVLFIQRC